MPLMQEKLYHALKLGNVPKGGVRDGVDLLSATQMTLAHASLSFRDRSLVSRLLKAYSAAVLWKGSS
jgi:hypothetical protein